MCYPLLSLNGIDPDQLQDLMKVKTSILNTHCPDSKIKRSVNHKDLHLLLFLKIVRPLLKCINFIFTTLQLNKNGGRLKVFYGKSTTVMVAFSRSTRHMGTFYEEFDMLNYYNLLSRTRSWATKTREKRLVIFLLVSFLRTRLSGFP